MKAWRSRRLSVCPDTPASAMAVSFLSPRPSDKYWRRLIPPSFRKRDPEGRGASSTASSHAFRHNLARRASGGFRHDIGADPILNGAAASVSTEYVCASRKKCEHATADASAALGMHQEELK